ncbi:hypothetical protein Tco_1113412 [Tanacetum coccineum]|uniref:Uncharacterized protein n=1 Tax=Tanacetum coccineum TaxID=301880 RepID=A0ABQ5IVU7_9ASTR
MLIQLNHQSSFVFTLKPCISNYKYNARRSLRYGSNRNTCLASGSSSSLTVASKKDKECVQEGEEDDLKSWMHNNGLPPCKVVLKDRIGYDSRHPSIHYVAASEDLKKHKVLTGAIKENSEFLELPSRIPLGSRDTAVDNWFSVPISFDSYIESVLRERDCWRKEGKESFWYPYIKKLDRQRGRGQLAVDNHLGLKAEMDYLSGSPIKNGSLARRCGPQPNSKFTNQLGFVYDDNSFDRLVVEAALSTEDPQYQDKRLVAQRNGKLTIQTYSRQEVSFLISIQTCVHMGYVSDPQDMESVMSSQGPVCPLAECDVDPKKRVATQLIRCEKRILSRCLEATEDLINQLPDLSLAPCPAPYAPLLR